jgi:hypothetical protein
MSGGANLPIVIQQTGQVSKVAESVGRAGEQQQEAAQTDMARQAERRRRAVQQAEHSDGENRVRPDGGAEERRRERRRRQQARAQAKSQAPEGEGRRDKLPGEEGGLVDVKV